MVKDTEVFLPLQSSPSTKHVARTLIWMGSACLFGALAMNALGVEIQPSGGIALAAAVSLGAGHWVRGKI